MECVRLSLSLASNNIIKIEYLSKCGKNIGSGKYILSQLKIFADIYNIILIIGKDSSQIFLKNNININLKLLYILSIGKTWYNTMNFYETNYENNNKILKLFINDKIYNLNNYLNKTIDEEDIELFFEMFNINKDNSISILFNNILKIIKTETNNETYYEDENLMLFLGFVSKLLNNISLYGFKEPIDDIIHKKSKDLSYYPNNKILNINKINLSLFKKSKSKSKSKTIKNYNTY